MGPAREPVVESPRPQPTLVLTDAAAARKVTASLMPTLVGTATNLYKVPDAVPAIHAVSSHVAMDKHPSKFQSIFSDNLQPIATRG